MFRVVSDLFGEDPSLAEDREEVDRSTGVQGQFAKAEGDFSEYIRRSPNDPQGYEARARAYFDLGNLEKSSADEKTAKELRGMK